MTAAAQLPINLKANPRLSSWLRFDAKGFVELSPGKVEIGQGIVTALAQIAADELDIGLDRIRMIRAGTATSPNEGTTSSSLSVEQSGSAVRQAAAQARAIYLGRQRSASASPPTAWPSRTARSSARATCAPAIGSSPTMHCWRATRPRHRRQGAQWPGASPASPAQRLDLPDKVFGRPRFVHDLALPGMVHGRVMKPPGPGATLAALDEAGGARGGGRHRHRARWQLRRCRRRDGGGGGSSARRLAQGCDVGGRRRLPDESDLAAWLRSQPAETTTVDERKPAAPSIRRARSGGNIRGPSSPTPRWRRRARSRSGAARQRADLVALPGRLQSAGGPALALGMSPEGIVVQPCRGRRLLRPQRRRRRRLRCGAAGARRRRVARCACNGRARTSLLGRRWAPPWRSRSRPTSTRAATSSAGAGTCGATATCRGPDGQPIPTLLAASQLAKPFERLIAFNPPMMMVAAPSATQCRSTTSRRCNHLPSAADHADPHLGAAHARCLRQHLRHRVLHGRAGRGAWRGPVWPFACATSRSRAPAP